METFDKGKKDISKGDLDGYVEWSESILKTKSHFLIDEGAPQSHKGGFVLVHQRVDDDLVIAIKSIHEAI